MGVPLPVDLPAKAVALHDQKADEADKLMFLEGEIIIITEILDEKQAKGYCTASPDIVGRFRSRYVQVLKEGDDPQTVLNEYKAHKSPRTPTTPSSNRNSVTGDADSPRSPRSPKVDGKTDTLEDGSKEHRRRSGSQRSGSQKKRKSVRKSKVPGNAPNLTIEMEHVHPDGSPMTPASNGSTPLTATSSVPQTNGTALPAPEQQQATESSDVPTIAVEVTSPVINSEATTRKETEEQAGPSSISEASELNQSEAPTVSSESNQPDAASSPLSSKEAEITAKVKAKLMEETPPLPSSTATEAPLVADAATEIPKRSNLDESNTDMFGFAIEDPEEAERERSIAAAMREKYREREQKWRKMLDNFEKYRRSDKLRERCRKGIPPSVRPLAWIKLAQSDERRKKFEAVPENKGKSFQSFIKPDRPEIIEVIERDIDRCYPNHLQFRQVGCPGQLDLAAILKAYCFYNRSVGYAQGMGMITGMMLMQMTADDAFWLLVSTVEERKYLRGFFDETLSHVRLNAAVLHELVKQQMPALHNHLTEQGVETLMYSTQWFMCLFTTTLPWTTVLRIWDILYCEGNNILLKIALAILKELEHDLLRKCPTLQEILSLLLHIPPARLQPDNLIPKALAFKLKDAVIDKIRLEEAKKLNITL